MARRVLEDGMAYRKLSQLLAVSLPFSVMVLGCGSRPESSSGADPVLSAPMTSSDDVMSPPPTLDIPKVSVFEELPSSRPATPVAYAPVADERVAAPAEDAATAVTRALAVMGDDTSIVSATPGQAPSADDWQGTWLYTKVSVRDSQASAQNRAIWEAQLIQGAVAEQLAPPGELNLANVVPGSVISFATQDGSTIPDMKGGAGDVRANERFADLTDRAVRDRVESAVKGTSADIISVDVYQLFGTAAAVSLRVNKIDGFYQTYLDIFNKIAGSADAANPELLSGIYVELLGADGKPLLKQGMVLRVGTGSLWSDPSTSAQLGIPNGSAQSGP